MLDCQVREEQHTPTHTSNLLTGQIRRQWGEMGKKLGSNDDILSKERKLGEEWEMRMKKAIERE